MSFAPTDHVDHCYFLKEDDILDKLTTLGDNDTPYIRIVMDGTVIHDHDTTPSLWIELRSLQAMRKNSILRKMKDTYELGLKKMNKPLLCDTSLEDIECNYSFRCQSGEN